MTGAKIQQQKPNKCNFSMSAGKLCQQADPCASNPCSNGGHCSAIESHYVCTCTPFFSGKTCKQDVNECAASPSPCHNSGLCVNEVGGYRCNCPAEYTGERCESRYLPCSPSPCHNGGTCVQKGDTSYECSCVPGKESYIAIILLPSLSSLSCTLHVFDAEGMWFFKAGWGGRGGRGRRQGCSCLRVPPHVRFLHRSGQCV